MKRVKPEPKIVPKPWGEEIWLTVNKKYALKILRLRAGCRCSLQYHKVKDETWYITEGELEVIYNEKSFPALPGDIIHVPPKTVHRLRALEPSELLEVSTPELNDVVRLEDDYQRVKK